MPIQIIGNTGNNGFALPMVRAYPIDVNSQQMLAWNPVEQALDYVPFIANAMGDFTVARDLGVVRNASVGGTLDVTGLGTFNSLTVTGPLVTNGGISAADGGLEFNGTAAFSGAITTAGLNVIVGSNNSNLSATGLFFQGTKSVGLRQFGWAPATGAINRATFDTATVTTSQLAERVKALLDDLTVHGLIGA